MPRSKPYDQKVAEAFVIGTLLPVLQASSDNGNALRNEIIITLFGQVAFEDSLERTNCAAGLLELAYRAVKNGRDAGKTKQGTYSISIIK